MNVVAMDTLPPRAATATVGERHWRMAAIALLSVRFIQGFIYWGGGSRRFIYDPESSTRTHIRGWQTSSRLQCPAHCSAPIT
jgi:hypothetical protein